MDHCKVIEKIKKCLALSKSSNEHEAAAALRQAQKLMEKHKISDMDIELAEVEGRISPVGNTKKQPMYVHYLLSIIEKAFGVKSFFRIEQDFTCWSSHALFVGLEPQPEIAAYAFEVLFKQLKKDRANYIKTLKRFKKENKTRKADLFAEAWISAVHSKIVAFAVSEKEKEIVEAYMQRKHPNLTKSEVKKHKVKRGDDSAIYAGLEQGRKASLHHATGSDQRQALGATR